LGRVALLLLHLSGLLQRTEAVGDGRSALHRQPLGDSGVAGQSLSLRHLTRRHHTMRDRE